MKHDPDENPAGGFMTPATSRHKDEPERDLVAFAREAMAEAMGYDYRGWTVSVRRSGSQWYYSASAGNNETLHHSETYANRAHAVKMARIANPMCDPVVEE